MTERFRLAANVLLKRRLNNLVRIDNNVEIDRDFITCAEYQLFIDDMRQQGKNRQPDHWTSERFSPGDAKQPISGIRSSDAEEFCKWLTKKENLPGFKYRLAELAETKEILAIRNDIGFWCKDHDTFAISGITSHQWWSWKKQLSEYLMFKNEFVIERDFNLRYYPNLNQILNRNYNKILNRVVNLELYRQNYRILNFDLYRDLYLIINRNLQFDLYQDFQLDLNHDLYHDLHSILFYDRDSYFDTETTIKLDPSRYLNLYDDLYKDLNKKLDTSQASNFLLMYLLLKFIVAMCQLLKTIYEEASQNRNMQLSVNLSNQECKQIREKYTQMIYKIYPYFVYLVLTYERIKENMPAWEGIKIVLERE